MMITIEYTSVTEVAYVGVNKEWFILNGIPAKMHSKDHGLAVGDRVKISIEKLEVDDGCSNESRELQASGSQDQGDN
jgi:hypothetical protein